MTSAVKPVSGPLLLRLACAAATIFAVHLAIVAGAIHLAVAVLFGALAAVPASTALRSGGLRRFGFGALSLILLGIALGAFFWSGASDRAALVLPPFLGYMATSGFFGYSLLPGQEPVIVRMSHVTQGPELPPGLEDYARALTWGWALLPALLAFIALAVLYFAGLEAWSWATNVVNPVILVGFFIGEHFYRAWRMPHIDKPSILRTLDIMMNSSAWRRSS